MIVPAFQFTSAVPSSVLHTPIVVLTRCQSIVNPAPEYELDVKYDVVHTSVIVLNGATSTDAGRLELLNVSCRFDELVDAPEYSFK